MDDAQPVCEALLATDPCIAGVALVHRYGACKTAVPPSVAEHATTLAKAALAIFANAQDNRQTASMKIDDVLSCMGVAIGDGKHALLVVFFDEPALVCRLPHLMAQAISELRPRSPDPLPPKGGSSGGTPSEARAFVSVNDREN